jgi:hypothetical protein
LLDGQGLTAIAPKLGSCRFVIGHINSIAPLKAAGQEMPDATLIHHNYSRCPLDFIAQSAAEKTSVERQSRDARYVQRKYSRPKTEPMMTWAVFGCG